MKAVEQLGRMVLLCRDYVVQELSDKEIVSGFQSARVLCVSDATNLSTHSGQTALVTLVSLLGRMGVSVELRIPETRILLRQPPLSGPSLREALLSSSEVLISGATVRGDSGLPPAITFALGDTRIEKPDHLSWRLSGTEWAGALAPHTCPSNSWSAEWPVGSMVSAALAANEVFKFVMRGFPLRFGPDAEYFELSVSCGWDFGTIGLPQGDIDLGEVDWISGGAIAQAALYALMRIPGLKVRGRVFDDDVTGSSNLNRNMLTLLSDVGSSKVGVISKFGDQKFELEPVENRFVGNGRVPRLARCVLVGVDDIPSRWEVQRHAPHSVIVSGTTHFNVSSSAHSPGQPCSACLHHVDDPGANPIPTVSFVSFWAGLTMAVRVVRGSLEQPYPRGCEHLWLTPLRMDRPHAAVWSPVPVCKECPACCPASKAA